MTSQSTALIAGGIVIIAFTVSYVLLLLHASRLRRRIVRLEQAIRTIRNVARHRADEVLTATVEGLLRAAELDIDADTLGRP